ncbi:hypothetical protein QTP86_027581 [Hemibagrus guttatus]|nr:hypothetical protein QTP86_027581 [Hemibagrus guttatus]
MWSLRSGIFTSCVCKVKEKTLNSRMFMFSRFTCTTLTTLGAYGRCHASQFGGKLQHMWIKPRNLEKNSSTRSYSRLNVYDEVFIKVRENPELFWSEAAQNISWAHRWTKTLDCADKVFPKWFVGGELNMCYNAVDRHVEAGRGDQTAVIHDSPVTQSKQSISYKELLDQVSKLAGVLVKHGVKKGDMVVIYMPMVPQAMITMLACARIGAPHSLIFGGFASKELSVRIDHAKPKLLVTASFGIEPGRRVDYIPLVEKALELSSHKPDKVLIYSRPGMEKVHTHPELSLDWDEEMSSARPHDCVSVPARHPLYVLYTSGTTGTPKGVVRDTGGYAVMLNWTMSNIYGLNPGELRASGSGGVRRIWVGSSDTLTSATVLFSMATPPCFMRVNLWGPRDPGAFFRVMSEHGTASVFTAPTAIRAIRQQDPHSEYGKQYTLKRKPPPLHQRAAQRSQPRVWVWGILSRPLLELQAKPVPGYNVTVIDDDMQQVKPRTLGNIVVKLPLPPGAALSLWQNNELFKQLYYTKFPGYYDTMDAGYVDEEGFVYIMSRSDDVINVAGHRLSTGALEECVLQHPGVVDCAVVGLEDSLKGHVPLALCVLRHDFEENKGVVMKELVSLVRENIGPVAAFRNVLFVRALPKTRSGKIPRSSLSSLINTKPYKISPTIEDPAVFKTIEKVVREHLKRPGS